MTVNPVGCYRRDVNTASRLRDVSRAAVHSEIAEAAEALFAAQGFDATTVDQIAEAVGMSQRTFFRYFPSKEDAALDSVEHQNELLLERLASRPLDEDEWASLRSAFDLVVEQCADATLGARIASLHGLLHASPTLLAAYLERSAGLQKRMVATLHDRAAERGDPAESDAVLRAVVGSAFACLEAAIVCFTDGSVDGPVLAGRLDEVMTALRPARYL